MRKIRDDTTVPDRVTAEFFNDAYYIEEKLQYFSCIQDYTVQMELLDTIPSNERYKFIAKIKNEAVIADELNGLEDGKKVQTFNYVAKQLKGNHERLLQILALIDFDVEIPTSNSTLEELVEEDIKIYNVYLNGGDYKKANMDKL